MRSDWDTATALLRLSATLVDGIQAGTAAAGFRDVRPVHGFVFAILAAGPTTAGDVAAQLGVTKQAAAQLIDHLQAHGYVRRRPDPHDGRARLVEMTDRGHDCTRAAEAAARAVVAGWRSRLPAAAADGFDAALATLAEPGRLRPAW